MNIFSMIPKDDKYFLNSLFRSQVYWLLLAISLSTSLNAQTLEYNFGARSKGVGHANTTLADQWSILNNVAGISGVEQGTVAFGYDRYFGIEGFDRVAVGIIHPIKPGAIGLSAIKFGDDLYSEQLVSCAFGNKIGFVRLGLRASYYQMRIEEFGSASSFLFDLGGIVELIPDLSFGAYISNFTASKLNNADQSPLPVVMKIGFSYQPTDNIMLNFDIQKEVEFDPEIRVGLEYQIIENIFVRSGINAQPFNAYFGGGLELGRFVIDYAVSSHQFLGMSHQASVSFQYQK